MTDSTREGPGGSAAGSPILSRPAFLYLHYMTEAELPRYPVYLFPVRPKVAIEAQIADAVEAIRRHSVHPLEFEAGDEWRAFSYVAFILDAPIEVNAVTVEFGEHAFENPVHLPLGHDRWSGWYFTNSRKKRGGGQLGPKDREQFVWTLNHQRTHTSSGTNVGP